MTLGLVDELATSEEYIRSKMHDCDVIAVEPRRRHRRSFRALLEQGADAAATVADWGRQAVGGVGIGPGPAVLGAQAVAEFPSSRNAG